MIHMDPISIGWRALFKSWLEKGPKLIRNRAELMTKLYERLVDPTLAFVRKNCNEFAITTDMNLVRSLMNMIEMQLGED